jgi:hypothetical protein
MSARLRQARHQDLLKDLESGNLAQAADIPDADCTVVRARTYDDARRGDTQERFGTIRKRLRPWIR